MVSGDTGRTLTTYFRAMGTGRDHAVDSPGTRLSGRAYKQPPSAKQKAESTARDEPKNSTPAMAAAIGQWICFVLGVVCIVCGAFGIRLKHIEGPPSASVAWLGSAYMPTLRVTALLCLFLGLLLVRRGWGSPDRGHKGAKMEDDPEEIPRAYWILLLVAGAVIFIIRMLLAFQSSSLPGK